MNNEIDECLTCSCFDFDYGQCTMPSVDLIYACPYYFKKINKNKESSEENEM